MKFLKILIFLITVLPVFGQIEKPTTWSIESSPKNPKVGDIVEVKLKANIQKDWKLYSSKMSPEIGPLITVITFKNSTDFKLVGGITENPSPAKVYEEIWESDVLIHKKSATFTQKIKILNAKTSVNAHIEFQSCTDVDGRCVNGKEDLEIKIKALPGEKVTQKDSLESSAVPVDTPSESGSATPKVKASGAVDSASNIPPTGSEPESSLWKFLLIAFGAGFASIFMPCIYPIMPMTVSFFTKQKDGKSKAIFYGISIMLIFAVMGLITMLLGAPFLNFLSTHWLPNLIFFVVFILFGVSLLGAFEIVLPHETVNKIDRLGDKGGLIGIFFMALTLVVVSFSCTVPFVGTLLIAAAQGEVMRPVYGMLAFGLPFALVFSGLAMFPQYLKKMPKSGGWLNELKAVFGFLEFALALKFLSNIDLAYNWHIIHRNIFLVIWIVIAVIIGIYILGYMRLPKDDKIEKLTLSRIVFATIFLSLAIYMTPGVANRPLSLLSGILPPMPVAEHSESNLDPKLRKLPHNLVGFKDFDDALPHAQSVNKPILIDFTGHACANCRKMEENVWSDPAVSSRLRDDFVIASLYVDDKEELPKEKQYISKYDNKLKVTIGDKNIDLEIGKYNNNAQPFYIIVDTHGEMLIKPQGYCSVEQFIEFLDKGKASFQSI
ncbi:MAG: protein-disulfide reductase DsbD family protein [Spirosomataceae bacterium]